MLTLHSAWQGGWRGEVRVNSHSSEVQNASLIDPNAVFEIIQNPLSFPSLVALTMFEGSNPLW